MDIKHYVLKLPNLDMKKGRKREMKMRADVCKTHQAKIIY